MVYFKSIYTGQCYRAAFMPNFDGYVSITADEWAEWTAHHFGR